MNKKKIHEAKCFELFKIALVCLMQTLNILSKDEVKNV